jgi:CDP-diacylglycerol--glycerol-3-phosphate 3-phosphatidyltransferase
VTIFLLSDLFDGTMARLSGDSGTKFGALLDSTLDRISDAVLVMALVIWAIETESSLVPAFLIALITGFLISYIRARAESLGITCDQGIAERPERLIVLLTGVGFYGLGFDFALNLSLIILLLINLITIWQRVRIVYRAS